MSVHFEVHHGRAGLEGPEKIRKLEGIKLPSMMLRFIASALFLCVITTYTNHAEAEPYQNEADGPTKVYPDRPSHTLVVPASAVPLMGLQAGTGPAAAPIVADSQPLQTPSQPALPAQTQTASASPVSAPMAETQAPPAPPLPQTSSVEAPAPQIAPIKTAQAQIAATPAIQQAQPKEVQPAMVQPAIAQPTVKPSAPETAMVPASTGQSATATVNPSTKLYRLGMGDKIHINVFSEENLTGDYAISPDGTVTLPLAGPIQAAGLTVPELDEAVTKKLMMGYVQDPNVAISLVELRPYYILGEVNKPGKYPFAADMTVMNAVATAEGFTYRADQSDIYIRHANEPDEKEYDLTSSTPVQPGDTIRISERYF